MSEKEFVPKSILFTGGAGFIGSHVMDRMTRLWPQCKMVCLDVLNYCGSPRNYEDLENLPNFTFVHGNVTNFELVRYLMQEHKTDTILHFAAETHVDNSFGQSFDFTNTNVLGTHTLLECCKLHRHNIRRFIHVSTDEVYGESEFDGERKTVHTVLNPTNPYAATKAAAEMMVKAYVASSGLPCIVTRGNNVYGPKQYPEKLIPKIIHLLDQGKPFPLHGDGSNKRSFLYVEDVVDAFVKILTRGKIGGYYNIGSQYEISNKDVLLKMCALFDICEPESRITYVADRAFNDFRYHIDQKELSSLGWRQRVDFDTGLQLTKDWYLSHKDWWKDISEALKPHPFTQSPHFTVPQKRSSAAGQLALSRSSSMDSLNEAAYSSSENSAAGNKRDTSDKRDNWNSQSSVFEEDASKGAATNSTNPESSSSKRQKT